MYTRGLCCIEGFMLSADSAFSGEDARIVAIRSPPQAQCSPVATRFPSHYTSTSDGAATSAPRPCLDLAQGSNPSLAHTGAEPRGALPAQVVRARRALREPVRPATRAQELDCGVDLPAVVHADAVPVAVRVRARPGTVVPRPNSATREQRPRSDRAPRHLHVPQAVSESHESASVLHGVTTFD